MNDLYGMLGLPEDVLDRVWAAYQGARAALSESEPEEPTPQPADGEVAELVAWLRGANWDRQRQTLATRAADLLERLSPPQPADGEVAELVEWLEDIAGEVEMEDYAIVHSSRLATRAATLLERLSPPQPVPVSERLPEHIERALIKAECALSDIAEGEAEESEGDPLEWAEKRAAGALARIRPVMRQHQIQTSEWPPLPAHALSRPEGR